MSLLSALQPNMWTWQICYEDTKPASDHYAVTKRLHFGGNHELFGAASFANRECASNPHVSTGSCTMTCARCSWQWPPIPNVVARSYATQLFKAFQWWSWAAPPIHETPAQGRSIGSSSPVARDPEDSSITNNKWAGGWNHLRLQNTIKTWCPISAQTGITIIQTCHAQFW